MNDNLRYVNLGEALEAVKSLKAELLAIHDRDPEVTVDELVEMLDEVSALLENLPTHSRSRLRRDAR